MGWAVCYPTGGFQGALYRYEIIPIVSPQPGLAFANVHHISDFPDWKYGFELLLYQLGYIQSDEPTYFRPQHWDWGENITSIKRVVGTASPTTKTGSINNDMDKAATCHPWDNNPSGLSIFTLWGWVHHSYILSFKVFPQANQSTGILCIFWKYYDQCGNFDLTGWYKGL